MPRIMRRPSFVVMSLVVALALAGCAVSTESVVTGADATFDERLLGAWAEVGGRDTAVVSRGTGSEYAISYTSEDGTGRFAARLGRLGGRTVLDAWPAPEERELPGSYAATLVAAHLVVVIEVGDSLEVALLEADSLRKALEAGRVRMPWTVERNRLVLRGTTAQLRTMLAPWIARPGVLDKPGIFRRIATPARRDNGADTGA